MSYLIRDPELFGLTESSLTLTFGVFDASGPVDAPARVRLNGETRATSEGVRGTRHVRIEDLEPNREYRVEIEVAGAEAPPHDEHFPAVARTLPQPAAREVASFATLNDLHFGEQRFGGVLQDDGEYGADREGWDFVRATDTEVPYWQFMNEDAIAQINALDVDTTIIKGDIADTGQPEQFEAAAIAFARFEKSHHAFLGNHDYYARLDGREVDGYAILGQPPAPRCVDLAGWRLVLLETALPGEHHGVFGEDRLAWLEDSLAESPDKPTLVFMHHQPVPPQHANSYPNTIGIVPDHSLALFELIGSNPQIRGVLIGHTHRNRVRHYPDSGRVPFIEVNCSKDYPGGFGHYRLFEDGGFRQEVHRTSSHRALAHSTLCRGFFQGGYRNFALGSLACRSFSVDG
jgi:Icc protein